MTFEGVAEPSLATFDPTAIAYQHQVLRDIKTQFDYSLGSHQIMLSGSYGSAKSTLMAHIVCLHLLEQAGAVACLGRLSMPDLKETIYNEIYNHLAPDLREGVHFGTKDSNASMWFANGSRLISRSWHDKKYKKARSLKLSLMLFEELVENETPDAFAEFNARVGRKPGLSEYLTICATNPDSPSHWAYEYFIEGAKQFDTRHVYYSRTEENPFLPKWYLDQLKQDLDEKAYQRYGMGLWVELAVDRVYYMYESERNYRDYEYEVNDFYPIHVCWDFNIGEGKPLSGCLAQFIKGVWHFYDEFIIDGADTAEACEEIGARGLLDHDTKYLIQGDATGGARSTKSKKSDYDIINKYFSNYRSPDGYRIDFEKRVPKANPPIRARHNITNGYFRNANRETRLFVYKNAKTLHKGFKLTSLKKGGSYIEDDSKPFQHVTTAAGYAIHREHVLTKNGGSRTTTRKAR